MAEGFGMSGGGNVQAGTMWVQVAIKDYEKFIAQTKEMGNQINKTGQTGQKSMMGLTDSVKALATHLLAMVGTVQIARTVWDSWLGYGKQETAINRIVVSMESMGMATSGMRQELDQLGSTFIAHGQREEAAWSSYRRLIQATHDRRKAQELLNTALDFAIRQETDVETVSIALAKAYIGQYKNLDMLLLQYGEAGREAKTFAEALGMVERLGAGANRVLSIEEQSIYAVKSAWDQLRDTLGRGFSPQAVEGLRNVERFMKALSETGRKPGEMTWFGANVPGVDRMDLINQGYASWQIDYYMTHGEWPGWKNIPISGRPGIGGGGGGKGRLGGEPPAFDDIGYLLYQAEQLRGDRIPRYEGWPKDAVTELNEWEIGAAKHLTDVWEAQQKLRVEKWDEAHEEMFRITDTFTSTVGNLMERMLSGSQITFDDIASAFRSMIARMLTDLAMSRLQAWFTGAITAGSFGGGARPVIPGDSTTYRSQGFGGARPIGGGGTTVVIRDETSAGILARIYRGATPSEQKHVSRSIIMGGARTAILTT